MCKQVETKKTLDGRVYNLSVDHNHLTGEIRDLLCLSCNLSVGRFLDDAKKTRQIITYLEKWLN